MVVPTLADLNPQELHHYLFIISLDRCDEYCNTVEDPFDKICVPKKIEDVNLKVLNIVKGINESKRLIKHILCECRCVFDGRKFNSK